MANAEKLQRLDELTLLLHRFFTSPMLPNSEPTKLELYSGLSREIDRFYGMNGELKIEGKDTANEISE